jgi:hypothetical protein
MVVEQSVQSRENLQDFTAYRLSIDHVELRFLIQFAVQGILHKFVSVIIKAIDHKTVEYK